MIGIYRIKNILNEHCYYGSSKNIKRRWDKHKSQLKYNRHENIMLQRAWNKYGENNFIFEVVELCEEYELLIIEQKYLDLKPKYNIGKQASGGDNLTNHPNKNEIINKRSKTFKHNFNLMTENEKIKKWSRPKEMNPNWKGGASIKYCVCGKKIAPENNYCIKCLPRNGKNNPFYGKKHTDETKKILSEKNLGKKPTNMTPVIINGVNYESLNDASNKLNIPVPTIRWRVLSKNIKFDNYQYK